MQFDDLSIYVRGHQQDKMNEAQQWRLAQAAKSLSKPAYAPLLARTGQMLSELGEHLQERYGQTIDIQSKRLAEQR